jgi:hypothetical protein
VFCEKEKKSKCPKKNFQSVEREKNVSVGFRVFGKKMEIKRKVPEKEKSKCFGWKFKVKDFAKFVFTGWAFVLICKLKLRKKNDKNFRSIFFFRAVV